VTADQFRKLALALPEAVESSHMDHPDFRVGGKIFASLGPKEEWGMAKLDPAQQASFVAEAPDHFRPARGVWGARGATIVTLRGARVPVVREALALAWRNVAPKRLLRERM
jgi:hypothetical protein